MILYNLIVLVGGLIALPKWVIQKKYKGSRRARLGLIFPSRIEGKPRIWFHMVSVGETRAMIPIFVHLKQTYPQAAFYFSNATKTGQEEAKRHFKGTFFILPMDLSWIMRKLISKIQPDLLILSETDFWQNQINAVKKQGGRVILLNGKISEKSAVRFSKMPIFSKKLFNAIDHLCIQNSEYAARFEELSIPRDKMSITGNLKLAIPMPPFSDKNFDLSKTEQIITIGSTHEGEEELLLSLMPSNAKILLVPRHPERFAEVKKRFSSDQVIVVDQMGILSTCYQLCDIAIVGGSFIPGIGGHNIFEPIQAKKPVIFGPYMENQKELVTLILEAEAGIQTNAESIPKALKQVLSLKKNIEKLFILGREAEKKSINALEEHLLSKNSIN